MFGKERLLALAFTGGSTVAIIIIIVIIVRAIIEVVAHGHHHDGTECGVVAVAVAVVL